MHFKFIWIVLTIVNQHKCEFVTVLQLNIIGFILYLFFFVGKSERLFGRVAHWSTPAMERANIRRKRCWMSLPSGKKLVPSMGSLSPWSVISNTAVLFTLSPGWYAHLFMNNRKLKHELMIWLFSYIQTSEKAFWDRMKLWNWFDFFSKMTYCSLFSWLDE